MPCVCDRTGYNYFIAAVFNECVHGAAEHVAFAFGWISIAFWIVAIYPQIRLNFCNKTAEALSVWFMLQWLGGDICNTISTILMRMMFTYQFLAVFYVLTDAIIIWYMVQYRIYKTARPIDPTLRWPEAIIYVLIAVACISGLVAYGVPGGQLLSYAPQLYKQCNSHVEISKAAEISGTVLAYLTIPLYGLGRPFQMIKNYKRKSVEGLSLGLFLCTLTGNITQCISLVAAIIAGVKRGNEQAPFIVSAAWPAVCDVAILLYFWYYNSRRASSASDTIENAEVAV